MDATATLHTTLGAARIANRSPETIRIWARSGRLRFILTSTGQRLFRDADVREAAHRPEERQRVD